MQSTRFVPYSKILFLVLCATVGLLSSSCGPSKEEVVQEIRSIDHEMQMLLFEGRKHAASMNTAEAEIFLGSFATGYGATSDNYGLALDGISTASNASANYDYSNASLNQIVHRAEQLMKRRAQLVSKLK